MNVLRRNLQILPIITLVFAVNMGYANTNGNSKKSGTQEQEQEGRRKSDQTMMRPDGEVGSESTTPQSVQDETKAESNLVAVSPVLLKTSETDGDTVKDDSVSKYNFIFYFLYKFKYDAEEAP